MRSRGAALLLLAAAGCAPFGRRVELAYAPSKNVVKAARRTPIAVVPFLDKREETGSLGRAPADFPGLTTRLTTKADVADWARRAAALELESAGYQVADDTEWKAGGAIQRIDCRGKKRPVCLVEFELWLRMKENWQVVKRVYKGEGARPPILPEDDVYALSLEEALREVMTAFRRDVELQAP